MQKRVMKILIATADNPRKFREKIKVSLSIRLRNETKGEKVYY